MMGGPDTAFLRRPAPKPIPDGPQTIPELLARMSAQRPNQEAVVGALGRYTYAELRVAAEAGAAALHRMGVVAGDRIAASAPNQTDLIIAFLAVQSLGAVWVGLSRQLAPPELAFQLRDCGASLLMADAATHAKLRQLEAPDLIGLRTIDLEPGANEWRRLVDARLEEPAPQIEIDPFAPAAIAYTSGTTGRPKGAVHSQHGLMVVAVQAALRSRAQGPAFRRAATLPLTILNIVAKEGLASFAAGGTFVIADRLDAVGVAEWIARERVESIVCSPPTVLDLIRRDEISPSALNSIEALTCGGGHCPEVLRQGFQAKFGKPLYVSWGLTEAPTSVSGGFADACPSTASGRVFDHLEVVVRGPDGAAVAPGERGELFVRAAAIGPWAGVYAPMLGYWGRPDETQAALPNGELRTGDVGVIDEDGWLYIVDRLKSVIVRGGQNIYPAEIEGVLKAHPDVLDAVVLAVPDERFGEIALAALELAPTACTAEVKAELEATCSRELAKYKCPERWVVLRQFPRNAMMKVNRGELRDRCLALLTEGTTDVAS